MGLGDFLYCLQTVYLRRSLSFCISLFYQHISGALYKLDFNEPPVSQQAASYTLGFGGRSEAAKVASSLHSPRPTSSSQTGY